MTLLATGEARNPYYSRPSWTGERIWNAPDLRAAAQAVRRLASH